MSFGTYMWNGAKNALQEVYRCMYEYYVYGQEYEFKISAFSRNTIPLC